MLSLEVQISKRTNRWVDVTNDFLNITSRNYLSGCKYWRTMKGVRNFIDKAIKTYPWLTRENFRINGTEEERRKPQTSTTDVEVHVGDVFISTWGYSMTLVDFYQVTKVSKTGKKRQRPQARLQGRGWCHQLPTGRVRGSRQGLLCGGGVEKQAYQG